MRRKKIKLQNLDAEIRATAVDCTPIFHGVVAHVNGYTQPSLQDLHRLIVSHGGGFLQYLDGKTSATHIIASSLTPRKCEEFRRYRIVKPAWVTESIKAGRRLPWNEFRVVDEGQSQKVLKFSGGNLGSQSNSPRSGYKEQSGTSWYNSQFEAAKTADSHDKPAQGLVTPSKQTQTGSAAPGQPSPSCDGATHSPATVTKEGRSKLREVTSSNQQQMNDSPFRAGVTKNGEDPDELESPRKGESTRIQVDPVLSNSTHKPLNISGSQFIMPSQPESKSSQPMGDIKSKLLSQAKPRPSSHTPHRQLSGSAATDLPPRSQLDSEILAALPEDVRREVLGHYNQEPIASTPPTPSPTPAPLASISKSTPPKSPDRKRTSSPHEEKTPQIHRSTSGGRASMQLDMPSSVPTQSSSQAHSPQSPSKATIDLGDIYDPDDSTTMSHSPKGATPFVEQPDLTSHQLTNLGSLQDSIQEWYSTFEDDGPYRDDVEAMGTYLRRVISEEEDVDKAVSVVRWLMWLACKNPNLEPEAEAMTWAGAIGILQEAIQSDLETKGIPAVDYFK